MVARVGRKKQTRTSSSGFKYKARSADDVKKRAEQTGGNYDSPVKQGVDMWRPPSGESAIRILPATWKDFEHYGYDVYMHRFIGSDTSNYLCLNKMKGKKCPACDDAKAAKDDGDEDEAKQLAFQKRVWVWIIDRADRSETPQIWDMSWSQDRDIADKSRFKSGKVLLIDHPDDGYDVIVRKTGSGIKTRYSLNIEHDSSPISEDSKKQDEILDFITENPVPDQLHFFSAEHIEKKLAGTTEEKDSELDDDEEEEAEKPRKSKKRSVDDEDEEEDEKPKRKKLKRPDPDPDEEEEEDDEEEEEKPKRKKRPDPEEDEDEEEEEEEEKPKRKKRPDPEEDAEDEDEEEEEKPKRKKKRPDPEDEEEEEEEEEEKPRRRSRR